MTPQEISHKNYYFLQTILQEMSYYDVISFDIFDTLLLRRLLFPGDVFRLLAEDARRDYGIQDFHYIRSNVESDVRHHSFKDDITLDEIYAEIQARYPDWPVNSLKQRELALEEESCLANPLLLTLYREAITLGKKVFLISDMYLPEAFLAKILHRCGFDGYEKLYVSGTVGQAKHSGNLYRMILETEQIAPAQWLHIGGHPHSDVAAPRQLKITAAQYHCPRDRFFQERAWLHQLAEEDVGHSLPEEPLNDSLEFSRATAEEINGLYTRYSAPDGDIVISVDKVSMMFNMSSEKVDNLKEYVVRLMKRQLMFQEFWALRDISFSVRRGEKVGLIGLNGSGKSTMLKILSGVMKPTKGSISVHGSIAPLIELGAGFDFELSARENVYLNGAILGYSREDMNSYYQEIIDFAELWEFQDVAIKNFSSGMVARLGFAIATCHVPDILIIDEILSVGDFAFQQKCHKKMEELTGKGATVLFVSHSAGDIINMCDRAIWLDHGHLVTDGEAQYIVEKYLNS